MGSRPTRPTTPSHSTPRAPATRRPSSRLEALGSQDDRLDLVDDQATVFAAAQHLPERERRILYLRFGEDLTQAEIAEPDRRLADAGLPAAAQVRATAARPHSGAPAARVTAVSVRRRGRRQLGWEPTDHNMVGPISVGS